MQMTRAYELLKELKALNIYNSSKPPNKMKNYPNILKGGDLRSIANANEVVWDVTTQEQFDQLLKHFPHLSLHL